MLKTLRINIAIYFIILLMFLLCACGNKTSQTFSPQIGETAQSAPEHSGSTNIHNKETSDQTQPGLMDEPNPNAGVFPRITQYTLFIGDTVHLDVDVVPIYETDSSELYYACNNNCVTVDEKGNMTAIAKGSATVTMTTQSGLKATVSVTVSPKANPNASLNLDTNSITLNVDDAFLIKATYIPKFETDNTTLSWMSNHPDVVTVDESGNLTALKAGQATITCTNADGSFSDICNVTVKLMWKNYSFTFKSDLSAYEWAMNPESDAYVFLVNKDHPLDKNYAPGDLVDIRDTRTDRAKQKMRKIAEAALHALYLEAKENGILYVHKQLYSDGYYYNNVLSVTSAYRTYAQQEYNFNNKVNTILKENPSFTKEQAQALAATTISRPGTSEHQSGLCIDMHNYRYAEKEISKEFGESVAGKWLAENCYKFGFILRYEEDKTDITGIAYESWHFRYVGRYHATRMYELDMCLEEYTAYLNEMGYEFDLAE